MKTFTEEEVAILLTRANYTGYVQGNGDRREGVDRPKSEKIKMSKREARRIIQHADSFLDNQLV